MMTFVSFWHCRLGDLRGQNAFWAHWLGLFFLYHIQSEEYPTVFNLHQPHKVLALASLALTLCYSRSGACYKHKLAKGLKTS